MATLAFTPSFPRRENSQSHSKMKFLNSLRKAPSSSSKKLPAMESSTRTPASNNAAPNPFRSTPTRRPKPVDNAAPPPYSPPASNKVVPGTMSVSADSPYAFLTEFDTIFLIDDSGSMAGRSWRETGAALGAITPICTAHDADGIDIYFLNHRNPHATGLGGYENVTTASGVEEIFRSVRPLGGTPTGTRLNQILKPYLADVEASLKNAGAGAISTVKPLNVIVITDGVPSDDVESVIVNAAKKLDAWGAEPWQVGIQFFQVGNEPEAAQDLQELDDALSSEHGIRDMVDTVPWAGAGDQTLSADGIMKVTMGAINRRLDRRRGSDERLRR